MLLTLVFCVALSRIRPKALFKGLKPLIVIVILTAVLNLFYSDGNVICSFWVLRITDNGIRRAVLMVLRIILLVCGTFLLTYTTSPLQLTDGLEQLLSPLKKLRFPVHELSMMMSIALRFIPTLIEETDKIISAQKARGADFESGSLVRRAKALLPILVPLFVSAFRRADELATAMECRCYNGGEGRTRMKVLRMGRNDYLALAFWAVILAGSIILTRYGHLRNIALRLRYDGSAYHGWQRQAGLPTVQQTVEDAIAKILGTSVHVTGCGRTDAACTPCATARTSAPTVRSRSRRSRSRSTPVFPAISP